MTACPACGSGDLLPIAYGLPMPDALPSPDVVMGGCCVGPHDLGCKECGEWFVSTLLADAANEPPPE